MATACIDEEMLADYLEGRLSDAERERIELHLAGCEACLQELVISRSMIQGLALDAMDAVPAGATTAAIERIQKENTPSFVPLKKILRQSARELYSRMSDVFTPSSKTYWAMATIRGGGATASRNCVVIRKTFDRVPTEIEIEKTTQGNVHIRVCFPGAESKASGTRVTLQKGEREVSSFLTGRSGYVLFEDVPFGHYSLVFLRNGDVFGTYLFELKETNNGGR
jgi:hypothetical protein